VRLHLNFHPAAVLFASLSFNAHAQSTGVVDVASLRAGDLRNGWHRDVTIEMTLKAIRAEMTSPQNKRLPQPPDGQSFE